MSRKKIGSGKTVSQKQDLRPLPDVRGDYAQASHTWDKYGFLEVPVMNINENGEYVGPSGWKAEVQTKFTVDPENPRNQIAKSFVRCSIPEGQAFVPMEAVDDVLSNLEKRILDFYPEAKKQDFKIEKIIPKISHNGNTKHWIVQTNQVAEIEGSHESDDKMKLGFCVRNGYNSGVALGIDLFTFRLVCENGAFVKGVDLAGWHGLRHFGKDPKKLLNLFEEGLMKVVEQWREMLEVYNKMAHVKLNQKMAEFIYKRVSTGSWDISDRFFPEYYQIGKIPAEEKKFLREERVPIPPATIALTNKGKSVTLWENYNDMTFHLWRAQDEQSYENKKGEKKIRKAMAFDGMVSREKQLHEAMKYVIDNPEEFQ
jgi:Domain of unknown function (DUF932)